MLFSHLVEKYPLPHTLNIAKQTLQLLNYLHTQQSQGEGAKNTKATEDTIENIAENIGRICGAFPMLSEDALTMLLEMASVTSMQFIIFLDFHLFCCARIKQAFITNTSDHQSIEVGAWRIKRPRNPSSCDVAQVPTGPLS